MIQIVLTQMEEAQKMESAENLEELILGQAHQMAGKMPEVARLAGSEEDVRHECSKMIDDFLDKADIKVKGKHEYGLAGGWIDSKYGGVIIEYKYPKGAGKVTLNPEASGNRAVVKKIKQRVVS